MTTQASACSVQNLGPCRIGSPLRLSTVMNDNIANYVEDDEQVLVNPSLTLVKELLQAGVTPPTFELAGPRKKIFFDPRKTKSAIVSCGGICPGINDVIRELVMILHHQYKVPEIVGFRYGFLGMAKPKKYPPRILAPDCVEHIHTMGGTILGTSRGHQDIDTMINTLRTRNIDLLFCIGGDGTFHGAQRIAQRILERKLKIAVVAIPKTIDNDILHVEKTFGFDTAVSVALRVIRAAHVEATGGVNGIGLVKLMGRHSGFIAAYAALAANDVNIVLIPELDFELKGRKGILSFLEKRLKKRGHAVIVVAEGAGQVLMRKAKSQKRTRDASGNLVLDDIGLFLKASIKDYFKAKKTPLTLKYIDPSYVVRSTPANAADSLFCGQLAQMAVHAGMAGKTSLMIGTCNGRFTHVPLCAAVAKRKVLSPESTAWRSVVEATGQPHLFQN